MRRHGFGSGGTIRKQSKRKKCDPHLHSTGGMKLNTCSNTCTGKCIITFSTFNRLCNAIIFNDDFIVLKMCQKIFAKMVYRQTVLTSSILYNYIQTKLIQQK